VFSLHLTNMPIDWLESDYVICVSCDAHPFWGYISKSPGGFRTVTNSRTGRCMQISKQAVSSRSTEEYTKSACEDLTCALKTSCELYCTGTGSVSFRETFIASVL
jgi:hypothetical protein